ncbi:MAG: cytochrome P460 family protein [Desulfomonile tiedjei]|nr:cytochrome P460 family protein [Desulfomonile tiedjei]
MNRQLVFVLILCFVAGQMATTLAQEVKQPVDYPEGYRLWTHVKSMIVQEGNEAYRFAGGIHHIYANKEALEALQNGTPYADGASLVFDLLLVENNKDHTVTEGPRKLVGVMVKDSKKFAHTGGWGFAVFQNDTRDQVPVDAKTCFKCHEPHKGTGYVISKYRK